MVVPAVATPAVTPGNEGNQPNPAAAGGQQEPGSGAPPQGAGGQGNPPEPGKDDKAPAAGGDPKAPSGEAKEPPASSSEPQQPEERKLTAQEWQRQQRDSQRQLDQQDWDKRAKEIHSNAASNARDMLDKLAEELDVRIPSDLRKPLLDLVKDLVDHGERGAELKHVEPYEELKETLQETSLAFLGAMDDAAMRQKFADTVRGGEPKDWVKALLDLKTPSIANQAFEKAAASMAKRLPEGQVRDDFVAKFKGEHDPEKLAQGFHDALLGVVGPSGEPSVAARGGRVGKPSLAEVTRRRAAGEYKTDAEFLADQDLALQGT